jgi:hypothetical protein
MIDDPQKFNLVGQPEYINKGENDPNVNRKGTGIFNDSDDEFPYLFGDIIDEYEKHPEFKEITRKNVLSHLYLVFLNHYENGLLEEYYYFVKGFQQIIAIENKQLCIGDESNKICVQGGDVSYMIEGETPYELFKTVKIDYRNGTEQDIQYYKTILLEIIKEMYQEVEKDDGTQALESTKDVEILLTFWTGGKTFPKSTKTPIKVSIEDYHETNKLPEAHTCFNQLIIPKYIDEGGKTAKEIFKAKLMMAMSEGMNFDVAGGGLKKNKSNKKQRYLKTHRSRNKMNRNLTAKKTKKANRKTRKSRRLHKYYN